MSSIGVQVTGELTLSERTAEETAGESIHGEKSGVEMRRSEDVKTGWRWN